MAARPHSPRYPAVSALCRTNTIAAAQLHSCQVNKESNAARHELCCARHCQTHSGGTVAADAMASDSAVVMVFTSAALKDELARLPVTPLGLLNSSCSGRKESNVNRMHNTCAII